MNKSRQLDFSGQDIFVGLDVHLRQWTVSIIFEGMVCKTYVQDPNPKILRDYLDKNYPNGNYYSVYEAGFCGFGPHRELVKLGIKNRVANPADVPTTDKERKNKTDPRDSRKLAKQLSQNDLTAIYIPEVEIEGDRSLIRYKKTLTKEITRNKNRVKSHLHYHYIEIPDRFSNKSYWSKGFTVWLQEVELPTESSREVLSGILDQVEFLRQKQYSVTKQIRKLSKKEIYKELFELLISVPGVACFTAMLLLTEIGDIKRFKNIDHLCSFIGLVPTTNSSDQKERTGGITPRCNYLLRTTIVESAWVAIRHDPALMLAFKKLRAKMESQKAIIRIAKKLVARILYVLKTKQKYELAIA